MKTIFCDKLRRSVIVTSTCLFILMATASSLLMNSSASFAAGTQIIRLHVVPVKNVKTAIVATLDNIPLYYNNKETNPANPDCINTGTPVCNQDWPPLTFGGDPGSLQSPSQKLPGTLAVVNNPNGKQVTYNGHLLYTYSDDVKDSPHRVHGQGDDNKWFVVTPGLAR